MGHGLSEEKLEELRRPVDVEGYTIVTSHPDLWRSLSEARFRDGNRRVQFQRDRAVCERCSGYQRWKDSVGMAWDSWFGLYTVTRKGRGASGQQQWACCEPGTCKFQLEHMLVVGSRTCL